MTDVTKSTGYRNQLTIHIHHSIHVVVQSMFSMKTIQLLGYPEATMALPPGVEPLHPDLLFLGGDGCDFTGG